MAMRPAMMRGMCSTRQNGGVGWRHRRRKADHVRSLLAWPTFPPADVPGPRCGSMPGSGSAKRVIIWLDCRTLCPTPLLHESSRSGPHGTRVTFGRIIGVGGGSSMTQRTPSAREQLLTRGRNLEYFTVAWNCLEGIVSLASGLAAGSVTDCVLARRSGGVDHEFPLYPRSCLMARLITASVPRYERATPPDGFGCCHRAQ